MNLTSNLKSGVSSKVSRCPNEFKKDSDLKGVLTESVFPVLSHHFSDVHQDLINDCNLFVHHTEQELTPKPDVFPAYSKPEFGDTVKITCSADGPLTILSWFKDGIVKNANEKLSIKNLYEKRRRKSVSELTISNINSSDAGTYTCKATTSLSKGYFAYRDAAIVLKGKYPCQTKQILWH